MHQGRVRRKEQYIEVCVFVRGRSALSHHTNDASIKSQYFSIVRRKRSHCADQTSHILKRYTTRFSHTHTQRESAQDNCPNPCFPLTPLRSDTQYKLNDVGNKPFGGSFQHTERLQVNIANEQSSAETDSNCRLETEVENQKSRVQFFPRWRLSGSVLLAISCMSAHLRSGLQHGYYGP